MRERNRKDLLCLLFVPVFVFLMVWAGNISVADFYRGAEFGVSMKYQSWFFLIFFVRVLYTFGDFEQYFYGYGVYTVTRHGKRRRLFFHSIGRLTGKVFLYQGLVLVSGVVFSRWMLQAAGEVRGAFFGDLLLYITLDLLLALLQMVGELIWDGRVGICMVGVYDMLSLLLSDPLYMKAYGKRALWILLPNLGVSRRVSMCGYPYGFALGVMLAVIVVLIWIGGRMVKKKDVL